MNALMLHNEIMANEHGAETNKQNYHDSIESMLIDSGRKVNTSI